MRRAARTDENQRSIVDHLERFGWRVHVASAVGGGFPDLVCARDRFTALVEVKNPSKPKRDQRLTKDQVEFHRDWPGVIVVALTPEDALRQLEALRP